MNEPAYSFTIPSLHDDTPLDCRIYHPDGINALYDDSAAAALTKGAIVAHPYAPLGGCYDDPVCYQVVRCLLKEGYAVGTFNFRGAPGSTGKTSWTGKPEKDDYASFAGFISYYLDNLSLKPGTLEISATSQQLDGRYGAGARDPITAEDEPIELLLAGYSYGSLILSKLPDMVTILQRFTTAERGTAGAEIVLRARRLALETRVELQQQQSPTGSRGRQMQQGDPSLPRQQPTHPSPVKVGGEETDPSVRQRSDSNRSADIVRKGVEVPQRIKARIRRHSSGASKRARNSGETQIVATPATSSSVIASPLPRVQARYVLISPLLGPVAHALVSPSSVTALFGSRKSHEDAATGIGSLKYPALAVWGSADSFTSGKRLQAWAEKIAAQSSEGRFSWAQIDDAGHFWREPGAMPALLETIKAWVRKSSG